MFLNLDTTRKICLVELIRSEKAKITWQWQKDTGQEVLANIQKLLKQGQKKLTDLKAIFVCQGPGSFTGTRVGITIANTLGWVLDISVIGYRKGELKKALAKISQNNKSHFSKLALPYYS